MSSAEISNKIKALQELEGLIDELRIEADILRDSIKAEMVARDTEELICGSNIVRYTEIVSNRFDSTSFKRVMPEVYKSFTKLVTSRRFSIV